MKIYLQNLLGRLSQFSENLDNIALFVEKPWVFVESNLDYHKYIFKRNGDLVMSLNGRVKMGKWEYLPSAKSMLIDRIDDKILLNTSFFNNAIMIFKNNDLNSNFFILVNETLVPDLDVKNYLKSLTYEKLNVVTRQLTDGKTLEIYRNNNDSQLLLGTDVTIDSYKPKDGKYKIQDSGSYYELKDGKIFRIFQSKTYKTSNNETLVIEQKFSNSISIGDLVYMNDKIATSGKYKLGFLNFIAVTNGVVSKKTIL